MGIVAGGVAGGHLEALSLEAHALAVSLLEEVVILAQVLVRRGVHLPPLVAAEYAVGIRGILAYPRELAGVTPLRRQPGLGWVLPCAMSVRHSLRKICWLNLHDGLSRLPVKYEHCPVLTDGHRI